MTTARTDPAAPQPARELDELLCFAVYSAGHAFTRVYKPLLTALGLTYPQYLVMLLLWRSDRRTVGQIGEALFLESSTLTPLLKRLEGAGLIRRVRNTRDERQVHVVLTPQGHALQQQAACIPDCMQAAISGIPAGSLTRLADEIAHLRDLLSEAAD